MKVIWDSRRDCFIQGKDGGFCIVFFGEFFGVVYISCNYVGFE